MTGAEFIVASLEAQRVRTVFALAGASHTHLLDALDRSGFAIVSGRHESGTVGAADGYARALADRKPTRIGVALIVSEQGIANAVGGLAVAHALGTPILVIAAVPPAGFVEPSNVIAQAQLDIVRPVSKHVAMVRSADELPTVIEHALKCAASGRPGPVVVFVPQDQFLAQLPAAEILPICPEPLRPDQSSLDDAARILNAAERPIAIVGFGALRARCAEQLDRVARLGIPVLGNGSGRGLVAEDGQNGLSWPYAQHLVKNADCVLVVGEILTQRLGFGLPPRFAADVRLIEFASEDGAFHRNRPTDAPVLGDLSAGLDGLCDRLERHWDASWLATELATKDALMEALVESQSGPIHPLELGQALAPYLDDETLLVGDGADIQNWMYGALRVSRNGGFIDHFPLGAMGSGTALAIGAAAALAEVASDEGRPAPATVLVTGDGALGFHPGELHAASMAGLNLKVIVGNDAAWGTEAHGQKSAIGRMLNTSLPGASYSRVAAGFGLRAASCDIRRELAEAIGDLFAAQGPALLDVAIDPSAGAELISNPLASSIQFSDLEQGKSALMLERGQ